MVSNPSDWRVYISRPGPNVNESRPPSGSEVETAHAAKGSPQDSLVTVTAQLRAAAQHRASTLSRNVMIDLERRLERKERCQGFATFLVGILLLNCVERMCWAVTNVSEAAKKGEEVVCLPFSKIFPFHAGQSYMGYLTDLRACSRHWINR